MNNASVFDSKIQETKPNAQGFATYTVDYIDTRNHRSVSASLSTVPLDDVHTGLVLDGLVFRNIADDLKPKLAVTIPKALFERSKRYEASRVLGPPLLKSPIKTTIMAFSAEVVAQVAGLEALVEKIAATDFYAVDPVQLLDIEEELVSSGFRLNPVAG